MTTIALCTSCRRAKNGLAIHYQLGKSTVILGESGVILNFIPFFNESPLSIQNSLGTLCSAASHLGLYCLSLSHKKGHQGYTS